jgi:hypothetical protein
MSVHNKFADMFRRAKSDLMLPDNELSEVVEELHKDKPGTDRYTLLYTLGKGGYESYTAVVEPFLNSPGDPMLAQIALWDLCLEWRLTDRYLPQLSDFVRGVAWDTEEDVRLSAITIAGEYLRNRSNPPLLGQLITIFENHGERQIVREAAYHALGRAMGRAHTELPGASRYIDLVKDTDPAILQEAKRRLASQGSQANPDNVTE